MDNLKVLILEDKPADVDLIEHHINRAGFRFSLDRAAGKKEFLSKLEAFSPDLILSDYSLPDINGLEAYDLVRQWRPEIPFIMVTGSLSEETAVDCLKAGVADYVLKDHLARLAPAISSALENKRIRQEREQAALKLRESEEHFRALIENASDLICVTNSKGEIQYLSPSASKIFGSELEVLKAKNFFELIEAEDQPAVMKMFNFSKLHPAKPLEVKAAGAERPGKILELSVKVREAKPEEIILNGRDITERKGAERALLKFERLAAIGEMAAGQAHLIRNPLATISATVQYLQKKLGAEPSTQEHLQSVLAQCQRLEQVVQGILNYSGHFGEDKAVCKAEEIFKRALELAVLQAGPSASEVQVKSMFGMLPNFVGYPWRLQQAFFNLLLNAFQAMPSGGELNVSCQQQGKQLVFEIKDSGMGMSEEEMTHIFEPFYTTKPYGVGLGLAFALKVAEEHGGTVKAERLSMGGMAFTFLIQPEAT